MQTGKVSLANKQQPNMGCKRLRVNVCLILKSQLGPKYIIRQRKHFLYTNKILFDNKPGRNDEIVLRGLINCWLCRQKIGL